MRALHDSSDHMAMSGLHEQAADRLIPPSEQRFHLTHAWVYALVTGDSVRVEALEKRLRTLGGL